MATRKQRDWAVYVEMSCDHAGLNRVAADLEAEMRRVLAYINEPRDAGEYLLAMKHRSEEWLERNRYLMARK